MLQDLITLLLPNRCIYCKRVIEEKIVCDDCFKTIKFTNDFLYPTSSQIYSRIIRGLRIRYAVSLCLFYKHTVIQSLLHALKYANKPSIGEWFGKLCGEKLRHYKFNNGIDCIIPVPLHETRLKQRGYNQSTAFAKGISAIINKPVVEDCVVRIKNTKTQTEKHRDDRFKNMEDVFKVVRPELVQGKNVLLVDDVITTGATLISCGKELTFCNPKSISVITIATATDL